MGSYVKFWSNLESNPLNHLLLYKLKHSILQVTIFFHLLQLTVDFMHFAFCFHVSISFIRISLKTVMQIS